MSIVGIFSCWKCYKKSKEQKEKKMLIMSEQARQRKNKLEEEQIEEGSKLGKLQKVQEGLTGPQINTSANHLHQPHFILPGSTVQPAYQLVNPYSGNHNHQPVPVVYDPATYGVQYDAHIQVAQQDLNAPRLKESVDVNSPTGQLSDRQKIVPIVMTEGSQIGLIT